MVDFFGVATAVVSVSKMENALFLPGGDFGIRYMAIEKMRINIGIDAALGKNDWGVYFRIGESFGR